mmetsp:Transcript_1081/g.1754  ORF Transcript_1081/g.1754 Transcript_1081/m.1754 type:complete len:91 (+) Transcript_1081:1234-1506(+)
MSRHDRGVQSFVPVIWTGALPAFSSKLFSRNSGTATIFSDRTVGLVEEQHDLEDVVSRDVPKNDVVPMNAMVLVGNLWRCLSDPNQILSS